MSLAPGWIAGGLQSHWEYNLTSDVHVVGLLLVRSERSSLSIRSYTPETTDVKHSNIYFCQERILLLSLDYSWQFIFQICTVAPVLQNHTISHKNRVSEGRWSLTTSSNALKCRICQEYVVLQDRWSLMPVVLQARFYHCNTSVKFLVFH